MSSVFGISLERREDGGIHIYVCEVVEAAHELSVQVGDELLVCAGVQAEVRRPGLYCKFGTPNPLAFLIVLVPRF